MMSFSFCVRPASILNVYASCWISGSLGYELKDLQCNGKSRIATAKASIHSLGHSQNGKFASSRQVSRSWCFGSISGSEEESYLSRSLPCLGSWAAAGPLQTKCHDFNANISYLREVSQRNLQHPEGLGTPSANDYKNRSFYNGSFYNISLLIVAPLRRQAGPVASHHSVYSSFDLRPSRNVFLPI